MRVKHPVLDAVYVLRPSQVDAWLAAGWVPVDGDAPVGADLDAVDVEVDDDWFEYELPSAVDPRGDEPGDEG